MLTIVDQRPAAPAARPRCTTSASSCRATASAACRSSTRRSRSSSTAAASRYEPAESAEKLKGGNSNWRGPIWFPTTFLMIESLRKLGTAFGSRYLVETPGSGGQPIALQAMAREIARPADRHLPARQERAAAGVRRRAEVPGRSRTGATTCCSTSTSTATTAPASARSHQTGWTALVANLIDEWR